MPVVGIGLNVNTLGVDVKVIPIDGLAVGTVTATELADPHSSS